MQGVVKFFLNKKSYGFITGEDGKDYFVYYKNIKMDGFKTLKKNKKVTFNAAETEKGIQAIDVEVIKDAK